MGKTRERGSGEKVPLGPGGVEWPGVDGVPSARRYFLTRLRHHYPATYNEIADAVRESRLTPAFCAEWKKAHSLGADWIIERWTFLAKHPELLRQLERGDIPRILFFPDEQHLGNLPPENGGPMSSADPRVETREDYVRRAAAHYDARASRLKLSRTRWRARSHFDWLAHRTAGGLQDLTIHRRFAKDVRKTETVTRGIEALAQFIGVPIPDQENQLHARRKLLRSFSGR